MAISRKKFLEILALVAGSWLMPKLARASMTTKTLFGRRLPRSKETIPVIGYGTWQSLEIPSSGRIFNTMQELLAEFYMLGGRVIDSSPMYGSSEKIFGLIKKNLQISQGDLKFFEATKVWTSGVSQGIQQIDQSFRRMQSTQIDLLQIHNLVDWQTQIKTLYQMKERGKIRYIGISHYLPSAFATMMKVMKSEKIDFIQLPYSMATRDAAAKILPLAQDLNIGVLINRPFEEGAMFERVRGKVLPEAAVEFGAASWAQLYLRYILAQPAVTCVIPATQKIHHLRDNMLAGQLAPPPPESQSKMLKIFQEI